MPRNEACRMFIETFFCAQQKEQQYWKITTLQFEKKKKC